MAYTYYCETCEEWFRAKSQMAIDHYHAGQEPNFMACKPAGLKAMASYIGVKPVYGGLRWRGMHIYIETGYSQTPSWGHDAGGWIHYTYESLKDGDGAFVEAPTETELIEKLKAMPGIEPDTYFSYRPTEEVAEEAIK